MRSIYKSKIVESGKLKISEALLMKIEPNITYLM